MSRSKKCPKCDGTLARIPGSSKVRCSECGQVYKLNTASQTDTPPASAPDLGDLLDDLPPSTPNVGVQSMDASGDLQSDLTNSYLSAAAADKGYAPSTKKPTSFAELLDTPTAKMALGAIFLCVLVITPILTVPGVGIFPSYSQASFDSMPRGDFIGIGKSGYDVTLHGVEGGDLKFRLSTRWSKGNLEGKPEMQVPEFFEYPPHVEVVDWSYGIFDRDEKSRSVTRTTEDGKTVTITTTTYVSDATLRLRLASAKQKCLVEVGDRKIPLEIEWTSEGGFSRVNYDGQEIPLSWLHGW